MLSPAWTRWAVAALAAAAVSLPATAQLEPAEPTPILGARQLALSPDGQRLAFTYLGDIWIAPSTGGRAVPLTNHVEMDEAPIWSPDGKWIAFSSNRFGNRDAFVVPAEGGAVRRLTWNASDDAPTDWTPDGRSLVIGGTRDGGYPALHLLDVRTGRIRTVTQDFGSISNAQVSSDGKRLVYQRLGFSFVRPRYTGSNAAQLWTVNVDGTDRKVLRDTRQQHLWPRFGPNNTLYAVTTTKPTPSTTSVGQRLPAWTDDADRTPNVVAIDAHGRAKRLTHVVGGSGVRFLAVADQTGDLAYEVEGNLYLKRAGKDPEPIRVTASVDDKVTFEERLVLTTGAGAGSLSPKGDRIVFTLQNDLWLVPVRKGKGPNADDAVQLTTYAGLDEEPLWTPDGKGIIFASDRDGSRQLYRIDPESKRTERLTKTNRDVVAAKLTPSTKGLTYWQTGPGGGLFVLAWGAETPTQLISLPREFRWGTAPDYALSPDERFVAYLRSTRSTRNLWVKDTQTREDRNITRLNASFTSPAWSADGKYLYWSGNAEGWGIYALPLQPEDARSTEVQLKYERPKATPAVTIDWTDWERRIRRLTSTSPANDLQVDPTTGDVYYLAEGDLWRVAYSGEDARRVSNGGGIGDYQFNAEFNQAFFVRNGSLSLINLRQNGNPVTTVAFRADFIRDLRQVRQAAFNQIWREYNRSFYDSNFHGRNWEEIRGRYEPLLSSVAHRNEIALVLGMMVGELDASHSEVGPGPGNPRSGNTAHLGMTFDTAYDGPGLRVTSVPVGAPGSFRATQIKPGEYIVAINGRDVRADEALYRDVLNDQVGRDLELVVGPNPNRQESRTVKYRALSGSEWRGLLERNLVETRRKYVEDASKGQIAYLVITGMGGANFEQFQREAWEAIQNRKGVIIDVRGNGGGNISDRLIDQIERRPHSFYVARDGEPELAPDQSWALPTVVVHAENSLSNAEMFPYAMRNRGLATLVGRQTPGYVIWTYGLDLVDGTSARMPTAGVYRLDGTPLENNGQRPDIEVNLTPDEFFAGKDPQLDAAIREVLRQAAK